MKYEFSSTYHDFLLRRDTAIAFMLSMLCLLYVVKLITIANVKFYPTIYRVTYIHFFNESVTGSFFVDNMINFSLTPEGYGRKISDVSSRVSVRAITNF